MRRPRTSPAPFRSTGLVALAMAMAYAASGCARGEPEQEPPRTQHRAVVIAAPTGAADDPEAVDPKLAQLGHDPRWSPDPGDVGHEPLQGRPHPGPWPGPGGAPVVSTWAGSVVGGPGGDTREGVRFGTIAGLALDPADNLYVADTASIRVIAPGGAVTRFDHAYVPGVSFVPTAIALDRQGNLYATDYQAGLYKFTPTGAASVVAAGAFGAQALGRPRHFERAWGLAVDAADHVYVSDRDAGVIKRVTPAGEVSTFATGFDEPQGLAFDGQGNLLVADPGANRILRVSPAGRVETLIRFLLGNLLPSDLVWHPSGAIYFSAHALFRLDPDGTCKMLSAPNHGTTHFLGPDLAHTRFLSARAIVVDRAGDLLVADTNGNAPGTPCAVRKVSFRAGP